MWHFSGRILKTSPEHTECFIANSTPSNNTQFYTHSGVHDGPSFQAQCTHSLRMCPRLGSRNLQHTRPAAHPACSASCTYREATAVIVTVHYSALGNTAVFWWDIYRLRLYHSINCHTLSYSFPLNCFSCVLFVLYKDSMVWVRERTLPTERPHIITITIIIIIIIIIIMNCVKRGWK
jgi:hypothetical protein